MAKRLKLDASKLTGYKYGDTVNSVVDQAGVAWTLVNVVYRVDLLGIPYLYFNGVNSYAYTTNPVNLSNTNKLTLAIALQMTSTTVAAGGYSFIVDGGASVGNGVNIVRQTSNGIVTVSNQTTASTVNEINNPLTTKSLLLAVADMSLSTNELSTKLNKAEVGTRTANGDNTANYTSKTIFLGKSNSFGTYFAEMNLYRFELDDTVLTTNDLNALEDEITNQLNGKLTPDSLFINSGESSELLTSIPNAIWTISNAIATLGTGSSAYKKLITGVSGGTATVTAQETVWDASVSGYAQPDDSLLIPNNFSNYTTFPTKAFLSSTGHSIKWKKDNHAEEPSLWLYQGSLGSWYIGWGGCYTGAGAALFAAPLAFGEFAEYRVIDSTHVEVYTNNVLRGTIALPSEVSTKPLASGWNFRTTVETSSVTVSRPVVVANLRSETATVTVDAAAPAVSITAPAENAIVKGTISVSVACSDDTKVVGLQLKVDGQNYGAEVVNSNGITNYTFSLDLPALADGNHSITVVARDAKNKTTESAARTVKVDNTKPTGNITAPTAGQTIEDNFKFTVSAQDITAGIKNVKIFIDAVEQATASVTPFEFSKDTKTLANGSHSTYAVIEDNAGNIYQTPTVNFTVYNPPPATIITPSPLPYARVGYSYTQQLEKLGGKGNGSWAFKPGFQGNMPAGSLSTAGLITIPVVGAAPYSFSVQYTDLAGTSYKDFTIPVSEMAVWDWDIDYSMDYEHDKKVTIFIPRSGPKNRQTRIITGNKWKLAVKSEYYEPQERTDIIAFWDEHFPSKNFLFHDKDSDEYFEAWISSTLKAPKKRPGGGSFEFTIEQV